MQELLTFEERRDITRRLDNILNDNLKVYEVIDEVCSWLYDEGILRDRNEGLNRNLAVELEDAREEICTLLDTIKELRNDLKELEE